MSAGDEKHPGKHAWLNRLLDLLFPRTCLVCGCAVRTPLPPFTCPRCHAGYAWIGRSACRLCGIPLAGRVTESGTCPACRSRPPSWCRACALFRYQGTGARLIHVLKYEGGSWLVPEIAHLARRKGPWHDLLEGALLVPVPLHPSRERRRGYNQAQVVARALERVIPGTQTVSLLQRERRTPSQTTLDRSQRLRNLRGAFRCQRQPPAGRKLVLVDDVLTTGATLDAATEALLTAGAAGISAFTLAHG